MEFVKSKLEVGDDEAFEDGSPVKKTKKKIKWVFVFCANKIIMKTKNKNIFFLIKEQGRS